MFKKGITLFILSLGFISFNFSDVKAEIVNNVEKEIKEFGDWRVTCDNDTMLDVIKCKISARFYNDTSSIYVQPNNKFSNQVVFIIPPAVPASKVKIRVGKNEIVESQEIKKEDFGVVPMEDKTRKILLRQMEVEKESLYIRFAVKDNTNLEGVKEITEKISMAKFSEMLDYYEARSNLYNEKYNKKKARESRGY